MLATRKWRVKLEPSGASRPSDGDADDDDNDEGCRLQVDESLTDALDDGGGGRSGLARNARLGSASAIERANSMNGLGDSQSDL